MKDWKIEKKWLMINQDRQAEMLASSTRLSPERMSMDVSRPLPSAPSPSSSSPLIRSFTQIKRTESPKPQKSTSSPLNTSNNHADTNLETNVKSSPAIVVTNEHFFDTRNDDEYSPEFFIKKFLDPNLRSVTTSIAANLEVSLRTRSIE